MAWTIALRIRNTHPDANASRRERPAVQVRMLTDMLHGMPFLCHRILEFVGDFLKREKKNIKIRISGRGTRDRG
jgi:hypothetical protein